MNNKHLSAYTPSNMDTETLEVMFVQRHKLLEQSVQWVEESLFTGKKNHLLFVGSRGSGKTHLTTMIIRRLEEKYGDDFIYIWLGEDDVIMNFTSLALAIINKMASAYPERFNNDCLADAKGKSADEVADIIFTDIKVQAGDKTLLIVKENMSDVFAGLKDLGQKRLRAHLQENNHLSILGTSQKLFNGISSRDSAFWGFFDVHHLSTLSVEDATQLISNIAKINGDDELVEFLASSQGNYRIRALHYLAGGNHRLYVELASFLTKASLDDFVDAITQLADHLTPYFQERIRSLSPQQAGIVQKLCELSGAIQVKVIAESLFIDERAVASQLKELKAMGYVIAHRRGRAAYYEISEPLLRLSLEVKNNHGKPLKIIASLFRAWFSDEELKTHANNELMLAYCEEALKSSQILDSLQDNIKKDLKKHLKGKKFNKVIQIANELLCLPNYDNETHCQALIQRSIYLFYLGNYRKSLEDIETVLNLPKLNSKQEKMELALLFHKGMIHNELNEKEEEFYTWNKLISMPSHEDWMLQFALFSRSLITHKNSDYNSSFDDLSIIIEMGKVAGVNCFYKALFNRSQLNLMLGEYEAALNDLNRIDNISELPDDEASMVLFNLAEVNYLLLQLSMAREYLEQALQKQQFVSAKDETLVGAIVGLGANHWKNEIDFLLPLYANHKSLSSLAAGLTYSVSPFVQEKTLHSSFKKWAELWRDSCDSYPEMQPAVDALIASSEALEVGNDKPLFALPKEIRDLVRPMFNEIFSDKN